MLAFALFTTEGQQVTQVTISERVFSNRIECVQFVNEIAGAQVVENPKEFKFMTADGYVALGGCLTPQEYMEL